MYVTKLTSESDLDSILEIEDERFLENAYKREDFDLTNENYLTYVLKDEDQVIAFILLSRSIDECEIYHVAIRKNYEGKGLGYLLVDEVFKILSKEGIKKVFLEVRSHNERAIKLYDRLGFVTYLERKHYYTNGDDALCKIKEL